MKILILLGTLKKEGVSNTQTFAEYFADEAKKKGAEAEIVKLVEYKILPGTYIRMGRGDEWPEIYKKITAADAIIFATPIWWNNYSSETQRAIERLDEVHDMIMAGKRSPLEGKYGGVIITGDGDGGQHLAGGIFNFLNSIGLRIPPYASVFDLSEKNGKGEKNSRAKQYRRYKKDHAEEIKTMLDSLLAQTAP